MANPLRRTALELLYRNKILKRLSTIRLQSTSVDKNLLTSPYTDVLVTNKTIVEHVWQNLDRWPDKTATVCAVTGHGYTYAQTHKMSVTFAASLRSKLKLEEGDKVAVILPNVPEYPCIVFGALQAGCVVSTMNPAYTKEEFKRLIGLIDCKAIVSSKFSYTNVRHALNELKSNIPVILIDHDGLPEGTIKFAEFAEDFHVDTDCVKRVGTKADDVCFLPFSSGTTGHPKAVELTHRGVVTMSNGISNSDIVAVKETTANQQSILPAVLPFFHIFGLNVQMLNHLSVGCKLVTMPFFKPEVFLQVLENHDIDVMFVVPPMVMFLGKHPAVTPAHLKSVKSIISGAAPISEADATMVIKKEKNIVLRQGYGLTESNGVLTIGKNRNTNYASVGHVITGEVKILDVTTQEALGPGKEGEILYRGGTLMRGYYKNEEATREVLTDDGWYKTGDIGKYEEDKHLYITERLKELIKVKGFQVPPAELEMIIRSHPKIADCGVVGIPDPVSGEAPKAFIVVQPGQTVDIDEIKSFVNAQVTPYKSIKAIEIIPSIPKNPTGKILRRVLKEKYC